MEDGSEKPIAICLLYPECGRKDVFSVSKGSTGNCAWCEEGLLRKSFSIVFDHKALQYTLSKNKAIPMMDSA